MPLIILVTNYFLRSLLSRPPLLRAGRAGSMLSHIHQTDSYTRPCSSDLTTLVRSSWPPRPGASGVLTRRAFNTDFW